MTKNIAITYTDEQLEEFKIELRNLSSRYWK